jgi:putative oxidoreductase
LSVLRIITVLRFFAHGSAKLLGFAYVDKLSGVPIGSIYGIAGIVQIIAGILLTIGLFSRLIAFIVGGDGNSLFPHSHAAEFSSASEWR